VAASVVGDARLAAVDLAPRALDWGVLGGDRSV
jgi:hypothetical protein